MKGQCRGVTILLDGSTGPPGYFYTDSGLIPHRGVNDVDEGGMALNIQDLLLTIPGLLIALMTHELAHGYMAYSLGDPTAKASGRLSLNPLVHLDPVGTLMLILFRFGWAKPVPINPMYFRDRRRGMMLTSLAGPASNFLGALVSSYILLQFGTGGSVFTVMVYYLMMYNIWLGLFNLLPIPPLDGSHILKSLAPYGSGLWHFAHQLDQYGWLILMVLLVFRVIPRLLMPLANAIQGLLFALVSLVVI